MGEGEPVVGDDFKYSTGLTTAEAEELLKQYGKNELIEKKTPKWLIYLKLLVMPMPIMIWLAVIVEIAIFNWIDMAILLAIQFINATIGWYETVKAGDAVAALKASLKPVATVKRDGQWSNMDATLLVPGDLVLLAAGSAVPADCIVNEGRLEVDQSALTGESLPVTLKKGMPAQMGSTAVRGEVNATVKDTGKNTFFGRTAMLLASVDSLGNLQKILMRIVISLTVLSLTLCGIVLIYLLVHREPVRAVLGFVVVLLVASIPIAIEIVSTTTLALGSRQLSAQGAIVTRLTAIEEMAGMNMLCSDKTGTLTLNKMVIQDDCPTYVAGYDMKSTLQLAAMAAKWWEPPRDALDTMVLNACNKEALAPYKHLDFIPFDPTLKRTEATIEGPQGVFKVTKGAVHIIMKLVHNAHDIEGAVDAKVTEYGMRGIRCMAVAKTNKDDQWELIGILTFLDPPRPDTKHTIDKSMEFGVDVKMITGDNVLIARETARTLGMGTNILTTEGLPEMGPNGEVPKDLGKKYGKWVLDADGFAQVFPEHKFLIVETLRQCGFAVGMTGDGVNDAPALKRGDVGIAVSGATDAARAAADIVLTQPGLSTVVDAMVIARQIFRRINNFINYRIAATLQLLCFFFIAVFAFPPHTYSPGFGIAGTAEEAKNEHHQALRIDHGIWPNFFQLPVIMLMLITVLNDGTLIAIGYDNVIPNTRPDKWNLRAVFFVSSVLAAVACVSSLLLLWGCLTSHISGGIFSKFGLPPIPYAKIITMIYLKVSISDFLTLFSSRTVSWFWTSMPALPLLGAASVALTVSTMLGTFWPESELEELPVLGLGRSDAVSNYKLWPIWVWIYCLVWWFVQDAAKVAAYWFLFKYDIFQVATGGMVNVRATTKFDDPARPLARVSAGLVEEKLLDRKLADAEEALKNTPAVRRRQLSSGWRANLSARVLMQKVALPPCSSSMPASPPPWLQTTLRKPRNTWRRCAEPRSP
eukprot:jgi/Botrbrau1/4949/Bobra.0122s0027.1